MIQTYIGTRLDDVFTAKPDIGAIAFGRHDDDILHGSNVGDFLFGGRGADELFGGEGNDYIAGGHGADYLYGGAGDDTLRGGKGADWYIFHLANDGFDTIKGFKPGKDHLSFVTANVGDDPNLSYDAGTGIVSSNGVPVVWIGHHPDFSI